MKYMVIYKENITIWFASLGLPFYNLFLKNQKIVKKMYLKTKNIPTYSIKKSNIYI